MHPEAHRRNLECVFLPLLMIPVPVGPQDVDVGRKRAFRGIRDSPRQVEDDHVLMFRLMFLMALMGPPKPNYSTAVRAAQEEQERSYQIVKFAASSLMLIFFIANSGVTL